ncbi:MAG: hypothetical protein ACYSW3_28225 [Planctomycetota bacterium]
MAIFTTGWGSRPIMRWTAAVGLACVGFLSSARAQCPIQLSDITKETGITFKHTEQRQILHHGNSECRPGAL